MVRYGLPRSHRGELFRSDAKAEGQHVAIGGWELNGSYNPSQSRWFSLELTRDDVPWAYLRGDPFRSIAALELLAVLVCVVLFRPAAEHLSGGVASLTASGDNQSNRYTLDRFATTKFPLSIVLMELAEQLEASNLLLNVCWRPREENEPADALTNGVFRGFNPGLRVPATWKNVESSFTVLPDLVKASCLLYEELRQKKVAGKPMLTPPAAGRSGEGGTRKRPRGEALRERQPW